MSLILNYIKEHENWEQDFEDLNIKVKRDGDLAIFKYSVTADFSNPIVREARGLILDLNNLTVVCFPFVKFGNYGETYVPEIDWSSARVQEKIDGSIIKLYYYNNEWHWATNGMINASDAKVGDFGNYQMLIKSASNQPDFSILNKDYTYIFELISPYNQVIVPYKETKLIHIGTRNNITEEELDVDINIEKPKQYPLHSLEDCIELAKTFSAREHEGFVVVDKNWNRVKVKSPDYLTAHYLSNNNVLTLERILHIIEIQETGEYLTYFPQHILLFKKIQTEMLREKVNIFAQIMEWNLDNLTKKDFALKYKEHKYFHFGIEVLYKGKEIDDVLNNKYWKNYFKDKVVI